MRFLIWFSLPPHRTHKVAPRIRQRALRLRKIHLAARTGPCSSPRLHGVRPFGVWFPPSTRPPNRSRPVNPPKILRAGPRPELHTIRPRPAMLGVMQAIRLARGTPPAHVECGSLLPLSAVRACPDVLLIFATFSIAPLPPPCAVILLGYLCTIRLTAPLHPIAPRVRHMV